MYGERRAACRRLVRIPDGKNPLGKKRRRWGIILQRSCKKWNGDMD
jgi:hypothetical protein